MRALWMLLAIGAIAGCLDSGADSGETDSLTPPVEATVDEPFEWHGHVGSMAAVCPAGITCAGNGVVLQAAWDSAQELTNISALNIEMSWQGDAVKDELAFGLATACDGGCDFVDYQAGTSPLTLNLSDLDPTAKYLLVAWHPGESAPAGYVQYGLEKDFHIQGTLTRGS